MKFLGKTPLTAAVRQAAEALKYTEDKATVILITDGLETCEADPCALGKELEAAGVDFTAHVVGFGLTADEGKQVACLAENTGGKYIQASDAEALQDALVETVAAPRLHPRLNPRRPRSPRRHPSRRKPEFNFIPTRVMAEGGDPHQGRQCLGDLQGQGRRHARRATSPPNTAATRAICEPGDYVVVARCRRGQVEQKLKIEAGQVYKPLFMLNAGTLIIHPRPSGRRYRRRRGRRHRLSGCGPSVDLLWRHQGRACRPASRR